MVFVTTLDINIYYASVWAAVARPSGPLELLPRKQKSAENNIGVNVLQSRSSRCANYFSSEGEG